MLSETLLKELNNIRRVDPDMSHYEYRNERGDILCTAEFIDNEWIETTEQRRKKQDLERLVAKLKADIEKYSAKTIPVSKIINDDYDDDEVLDDYNT